MAITFYATNNFTGDGTTVNWNINFADGYIDTTNVKARYLDNTGSYVDIAISSVAGNVVIISPAVANGQEFQIYRDTEKRFPLVDFSDGAILNETNLDTLATQAVMVSAEAFDQSNNGVRIAGDSLVVAQGIDAKAQLALDNSDAAVATANAIDGKAQMALDSSAAAVVTANAAASTAAGAIATANTALATANDAADDAATAITTANGAVTTANAATTAANAASAAASAATTTANNAANDAAAAVSTAGTALSTANTASTNASAAVTTANDAKTTAEGIEATADSALAASATAVSTANAAEATANAIDSKAQTALDTANSAVTTANTASTNAATAISTANSATTTANSAAATANAVDSKAQDALDDAAAAQSTADSALSVANAANTGLTTKAAKGANSDITSLAGLTTALSVAQGGTGAGDAAGARSNLGALSNTPAGTGTGGIGARVQHASGGGLFTLDMFNCYWYMQPEDTNFWVAHGVSYAGAGGEASEYGRIAYAIKIADGTIKYVQCRTDKNTTVDVNGFIKAASPVVNIYADGRYETNDESEGVNVIRQGVGEYLITGCLGLNADARWGGIDGGFEIPVDRNKQPRIWLDYVVNGDGSILVKTYHRTHPTSPVFARNEIEGFSDGDPIDIPNDAFISVRVEMPAE